MHKCYLPSIKSSAIFCKFDENLLRTNNKEEEDTDDQIVKYHINRTISIIIINNVTRSSVLNVKKYINNLRSHFFTFTFFLLCVFTQSETSCIESVHEYQALQGCGFSLCLHILCFYYCYAINTNYI